MLKKKSKFRPTSLVFAAVCVVASIFFISTATGKERVDKRTTSPESDFYKRILDNNKKWAETCLKKDPQYFEDLAKGQNPPLLWIGCSDSRVPTDEIIGTKPGEVFVHRNIANMVIHNDMNMLSVLDYAVNVLKVQHVIVCGHYGCGGVKSAMGNHSVGIIDNWIRNIKDVYRIHRTHLDSITDGTERFNAFVEVNVLEQVCDLAKTSIVQTAWANGQDLTLHGWVYSLHSGLIKDLKVSLGSQEDLKKIDPLQL